MNVCIVGDGLISLTLAKALVNKGINVELFSYKKVNKINKSRTIGISKANIEFFNQNILDIKKLLWEINKIEIYSDNLKNERILNFQNEKKTLFSILRNHELYDQLILSLKKNTFFKIKKNIKKITYENYNLIINCDVDSPLTKKYFYRQLKKKYNSYAHTTIISHKKILSNNTAVQIFTKNGPLAFLPISNNKTSIVYSAKGSKNLDLENIIKKYNTKYSINKFNRIFSFELKTTSLRSYYFKNILSFGELLHKIHPLAGQGFNMSIRDIKIFLSLVNFKLNHGLELDSSICRDFEKKTKHKNFLFSQGIDSIYEFFNFESKVKNSSLSKSVQFFGQNKYINKFFTKLADNGIII
tara:strand:+ start:704 stop:1771 length:1068 start_codon:yes stop_codon:yes gene_type:complete